VKRATLHNVQNVIDMQLCIGDHITVERAGDVIPCIVASSPGENRRNALIDACPACGTALLRKGPELVCPNPACPGTHLQRLSAAVKALDVENLGESTLKKLISVCGVRHLKDLFRLTAADLLRLEGFAEKSASNLLRELQRVRKLPEYQLLTALNIPNVGPNIAKVLLKELDFRQLREASFDTLSAIPGIGPERAKAIRAAFAERADEIDELLGALTLIREDNAGTAALPTVCFTGKMPEKRSFYETLARERGYEPADSVTSNLTLLVAADVNDSSSKLVKARKLGIKILSLEGFLASPPPAPPAPAGPPPPGAGEEQPELFAPEPPQPPPPAPPAPAETEQPELF